jgi:hypothetical protein
MAVVVDERKDYAVVFTGDSIRECENWIAEREKIEPEAVHAGVYGIDGTEAEDAAYQALRAAEAQAGREGTGR